MVQLKKEGKARYLGVSNSIFSEDDERSKFPRFHGEIFTRYLIAADRLKEIAHDKGLNRVQLAIAW